MPDFLEAGCWWVGTLTQGQLLMGEVLEQDSGRLHSQGQGLLKGKLIWHIQPATSTVVSPAKSTSSSWTREYLSTKRLILGEGTEAFFYAGCRGNQGVMTTVSIL